MSSQKDSREKRLSFLLAPGAPPAFPLTFPAEPPIIDMAGFSAGLRLRPVLEHKGRSGMDIHVNDILKMKKRQRRQISNITIHTENSICNNKSLTSNNFRL